VVKEDLLENGSLSTDGRGWGHYPDLSRWVKEGVRNHIYIWHKIGPELTWLQADNPQLNGCLEKSLPRKELPHESPLFQLSGVGEPV
jgi:hypothetical protein